MKRLMTPLLAISLLSSTAVIAQPSRSDNRAQSDNRDQEKQDKKQQDKKQQDSKKQAERQRTAQQQTERQRTAQQQAAQQRAAPQRATQQAARQRAEQQRTAQLQAEQRRAAQQRAAQERAEQQRAAQQRTAQRQAEERQRAAQQRAAQKRWSRGDRLPDQYRQGQYTVNNWQYYGLQSPPYGYQWHRDDHNNFFLVVISSGVIAVPVLWEDRDRRWNESYHRTYGYDDDIYYRECRSGPDPAGILLGGLIGALIGNTAGHGDRTNATIAGIIIGGAAGAALTSHMDCDDRSYAYQAYSRGFNDGRVNYDYDWRNSGNGHRGTFRVTRYYDDRYGFRCAEFRQSLDYLQSNYRYRDGRACLQPNGAWVIVG